MSNLTKLILNMSKKDKTTTLKHHLKMPGSGRMPVLPGNRRGSTFLTARKCNLPQSVQQLIEL